MLAGSHVVDAEDVVVHEPLDQVEDPPADQHPTPERPATPHTGDGLVDTGEEPGEPGKDPSASRFGRGRQGGPSGDLPPPRDRTGLPPRQRVITRFVIGLSAPESGRYLTCLFDLGPTGRPRGGHPSSSGQPCTQHYAVTDYLPRRRVMHRVAVVTDRCTASPSPRPTVGITPDMGLVNRSHV